MRLGKLIAWLEQQDQTSTVKDGFGSPHSDRGDYSELGFSPEAETTFGEMLKHAKSAMGATFTGWKGGEFEMHEYTPCHIGEYGDCGEEITSAHLKLWTITANAPAQRSPDCLRDGDKLPPLVGGS